MKINWMIKALVLLKEELKLYKPYDEYYRGKVDGYETAINVVLNDMEAPYG